MTNTPKHTAVLFAGALALAMLLSGCRERSLPILNKAREENGRLVYDSIPDFAFTAQDSSRVDNATFAGRAYVADFFFTSCPTICPIMARNMLRIYERFEHDDKLLLLSHTIDPKRDSVGRLRQYAKNLGVRADKWFFVTGDKDALFGIADDYFNIVIEDPGLPDGFDHSGRFILVDPQRHIRAYCQGTDSTEVEAFIKKIEKLLDEI